MSHDIQLPAQYLQYTDLFDALDDEGERQLAAEEEIAATLVDAGEQPLLSQCKAILAIVVKYFPVQTLPTGVEEQISQLLAQWVQARLDEDGELSEEDASEISKVLLIFALSVLHPSWVKAREEEKPLFEVSFTLHLVGGATQITANTVQQLDGKIASAYETLNVTACEVVGHEEAILALNEAARALLMVRETRRPASEHGKPEEER